MWKVILNKEFGDIVLETFRTKKEALESLSLRERLVEHITKLPAERVYRIEREKTNGRTARGVQTER